MKTGVGVPKLLSPVPVARETSVSVVAIINQLKPVACLISSLENKSGS